MRCLSSTPKEVPCSHLCLPSNDYDYEQPLWWCGCELYANDCVAWSVCGSQAPANQNSSFNEGTNDTKGWLLHWKSVTKISMRPDAAQMLQRPPHLPVQMLASFNSCTIPRGTVCVHGRFNRESASTCPQRVPKSRWGHSHNTVPTRTHPTQIGHSAKRISQTGPNKK